MRLFLAVLTALLPLATACGKDTRFGADGHRLAGSDAAPETATEQAATTPASTADSRVDGADTREGAPVTAEELDSLCGDDARTKTLAKRIVFARPASTCEWGKDGNLPFDAKSQLVFTARREEVIPLGLPAKAHLCDLAIDFPPAPLRYDDEILLLLDGVVLASSQTFTSQGLLAEGRDGLVRWDWSRLTGKPYAINQSRPWFIDPDCGDACALPPTETRGEARLAVKPETVRRVSRAAGAPAQDRQAVALVTLGDNDPGQDCIHDDVALDVKARWVETP